MAKSFVRGHTRKRKNLEDSVYNDPNFKSEHLIMDEMTGGVVEEWEFLKEDYPDIEDRMIALEKILGDAHTQSKTNVKIIKTLKRK